MNFTLDDDASQIVYSPGWGIQSPDNAALDEYFERTYHVAEQTAASVNLTFTGSAVAIYGSTGPGHVCPPPSCCSTCANAPPGRLYRAV